MNGIKKGMLISEKINLDISKNINKSIVDRIIKYFLFLIQDQKNISIYKCNSHQADLPPSIGTIEPVI